MSPICHPCIVISKREYLNGHSHHFVKERTNTKKGITKKHFKLQYGKDWMVIEIKGYAKHVKHQLKKIWNMMV